MWTCIHGVNINQKCHVCEGSVMVDNPGAFSNTVGNDLYVNPWWALRKRLGGHANAFVSCMTHSMGEPDLWFQGLFHELLWGPRHLPRAWRPGFHANLSCNGELYCCFWLPWRSGQHGNETFWDHDGIKMPYACNTQQYDIDFEKDVFHMEAYIRAIPRIEEFLRG